MDFPKMKRIPIAAAQRIADDYGYDQVIIIARRCDEEKDKARHGDDICGEHVTTYGVNKAHCDIAAKIGDFIKYKIMLWKED